MGTGSWPMGTLTARITGDCRCVDAMPCGDKPGPRTCTVCCGACAPALCARKARRLAQPVHVTWRAHAEFHARAGVAARAVEGGGFRRGGGRSLSRFPACDGWHCDEGHTANLSGLSGDVQCVLSCTTVVKHGCTRHSTHPPPPEQVLIMRENHLSMPDISFLEPCVQACPSK